MKHHSHFNYSILHGMLVFKIAMFLYGAVVFLGYITLSVCEGVGVFQIPNPYYYPWVVTLAQLW